jgi:hypothetical protein
MKMLIMDDHERSNFLHRFLCQTRAKKPGMDSRGLAAPGAPRIGNCQNRNGAALRSPTRTRGRRAPRVPRTTFAPICHASSVSIPALPSRLHFDCAGERGVGATQRIPCIPSPSTGMARHHLSVKSSFTGRPEQSLASVM